jgi:hypothetical protein
MTEQTDAEKAKAEAKAEADAKATKAAEAKARKDAEAKRPLDETIPGGRYEVNGKLVDANGKPIED